MARTWFERRHITPRQRLLFEQERAVLLATEEILKLMEHEGISKADLAKALGKSKAYVTQALSGGRNMTLRTLAAFTWACHHSIRGLELARIETPKFTVVLDDRARPVWATHAKRLATEQPVEPPAQYLLAA